MQDTAASGGKMEGFSDVDMGGTSVDHRSVRGSVLRDQDVGGSELEHHDAGLPGNVAQDIKPATTLIVSWADAYCRGNALLYFPREIRDQIYEYAMWNDEPFAVSCPNVNNILSPPAICFTSRQMREETIPVFLSNTEIKLDENPSATPSVFYWLTQKAVWRQPCFQFIRSLHLADLHLIDDIFEHEELYVPYPDLPEIHLAVKCINLEHLALDFGPEDIIHKKSQNYERHSPMWDKRLGWIAEFKKLKTLDVIVKDWEWMRLPYTQGHLRALENTKGYSHYSVSGFVDWIRKCYSEKGQTVEVTREVKPRRMATESPRPRRERTSEYDRSHIHVPTCWPGHDYTWE